MYSSSYVTYNVLTVRRRQFGKATRKALTKVNIDNMQTRRVRADLIMCYKMMHGLVDVDVSSFLVLSDVLYTRGNCKKLAKPRSSSVGDANNIMFSKRIANTWNSPPLLDRKCSICY